MSKQVITACHECLKMGIKIEGHKNCKLVKSHVMYYAKRTHFPSFESPGLWVLMKCTCPKVDDIIDFTSPAERTTHC